MQSVIPAAVDRKQLVEEIVSALTGLNVGQTEQVNLIEQMSRAAREVDVRTASAFGNALLDSLCEDPGNVRLLEALMILGLAHPDVLARRGISLSVEGRRLAILLEQRGESDRARCLLDLIDSREDKAPASASADASTDESQSSDSLIEENLERARRAVKAGRISTAISLLQAVLVADRSRRDVARMIRDLRYQESENLLSRRKFRRNALSLLLVAGICTYFGLREYRIFEEFRALPPASPAEASVRARLSALDNLIDEHRYFSTLVLVRREIKTLEEDLAQRAEARAEQEREIEAAAAERIKRAEAARLRGLMRIERGEYDTALEDFRQSLELSDENWPARGRVLADVAALEAAQGEEQ